MQTKKSGTFHSNCCSANCSQVSCKLFPVHIKFTIGTKYSKPQMKQTADDLVNYMIEVCKQLACPWQILSSAFFTKRSQDSFQPSTGRCKKKKVSMMLFEGKLRRDDK